MTTTSEFDDAQPITLDQWLARRRAEVAALRAQAHAAVDERFAEDERRLALDLERLRREMREQTQH
jgi:hypothetical protein